MKGAQRKEEMAYGDRWREHERMERCRKDVEDGGEADDIGGHDVVVSAIIYVL
jgi:hypothetical protein